jgi:SAM-dependent methyltransferase
MTHSKVMKQSDYQKLVTALGIVDRVAELCGGWDPVQHTSRRWEYAMMLDAIASWYEDYAPASMSEKLSLRVADHGCGIGLSPALMLYQGHAVKMYEPWVYGDETAKVTATLNRLQSQKAFHPEGWELIRRPLCELEEIDKGKFDVGLCISTLEHIGEYQKAWKDLLSVVKPGGLIFITTDFAEDEQDHYQYAYLRAGKMFTGKTYDELFQIASESGFHLLGGVADWVWSEECRLVNDYGYASLALVRGD